MASQIVGVDIGSANIRIMVCEYSAKDEHFVIRAMQTCPSEGLRSGYITNADQLESALRTAFAHTEKLCGFRIKKCLLSVNGIGLSTLVDSSTVAVSRADGIISEFDVQRVMSEGEQRIGERPNTKVLHSIPIEFKLDGKKVLGKPFGYFGNKLELKTFYITCATPHLDALISSVESCGVEVVSEYAGPIAESMVTLAPTGRNAGAIVVNIGAETLSLVTYEDGLPTSLKVYPIGSVDITNDIALGLRLPLEQAENIKIGESLSDKKIAKKVNEIIDARVRDMLELIDTHLVKIGRSGLLPAGIIFTGESANIAGLEESARHTLSLPARRGVNIFPEALMYGGGSTERGTQRAREILDKARGPEWAVVAGLCVLGMSGGPEESLGIRMAKNTKSSVLSFLRQFLP